MNITSTFAELFAGRTDAHGTWEGGSIKEPVTNTSYIKHLWGQDYIGIYPLLDDSTVHWGCSDIDVDEPDLAYNLYQVLKAKNITSWIEKTVRGYHVWIFLQHPTEAWKVRRTLLVAHQVARVPAKEINPKQEKSIGLGNYVRLPYPGYLLENANVRYMVDDNFDPISLESFLENASQLKTPSSILEEIGSQLIVKQPISFNHSGKELEHDAIIQLLSPYAATIFKEGPWPTADRSSTLVRFAHYLREDGLPAETAYTILLAADRRWGKFHTREDGLAELTKIIANVYKQ